MSLLGIDVGTTGCKAVVFDAAGRPLAAARREYALTNPHEGFWELDPEQVWQQVLSAIRETTATAGASVTALAVSALGEAVLPVDREGLPLAGGAISADLRAAAEIDMLRDKLGAATIYAITGQPAAPMPERISAWAVYDVFTVKDGEQIFLAAVSDAQWRTFCDALGFGDLRDQPEYATNNERVRQRPTLLPVLRERLATRSAAELAALFERAGLPFAPIRKPEELFDDEHLQATGGLADITLTDGARAGQTTQTTLLPFTLAGERLGVGAQPPRMGADTAAVLAEIGYAASEIEALRAGHAVA